MADVRLVAGCVFLALGMIVSAPVAAADAQVAASLYKLAEKYDFGTGVSKDRARAVALYGQACSKGHGKSCTQVGTNYEFHLNDVNSAIPFYKKGCQGGSSYACFLLGEKSETGQGAQRDASVAAMYFTRACRLGDTRSCDKVKSSQFLAKAPPVRTSSEVASRTGATVAATPKGRSTREFLESLGGPWSPQRAITDPYWNGNQTPTAPLARAELDARCLAASLLFDALINEKNSETSVKIYRFLEYDYGTLEKKSSMIKEYTVFADAYKSKLNSLGVAVSQQAVKYNIMQCIDYISYRESGR